MRQYKYPYPLKYKRFTRRYDKQLPISPAVRFARSLSAVGIALSDMLKGVKIEDKTSTAKHGRKP